MADNHCGILTCSGTLVREISGKHVYLNLCYAIATVKDMNIAKDIQSLLDRLSYEYIDLKIFRYVESNVCWRKEHDTNGIPMKTYLSHFLIVHGR